MLGTKIIEIDLNFLFQSILLDSHPDFDNCIELLPQSSEKNKYPNLYSVYLEVKNYCQQIKNSLQSFIDKGGCQKGEIFPHSPYHSEVIYNFYTLLTNNWNSKQLESILTRVKHNNKSPLALIYFDGKLSIARKRKDNYIAKTPKPICVDFIEGKTAFRINSNVKSEAVVKACLQKDMLATRQIILDATGGFGQDAVLLAQTGASVIVVERNPVIALLLSDGLRRLKEIRNDLKIELLAPTSITTPELQKFLKDYHFTTVYLDPMFPHKNKGAKVNKNMQLIQEIVGADEDSDQLLVAAYNLNTKHIVVKRPKGAPFLNRQETKNCLRTPSHRFDYYLVNKADTHKIKPIIIRKEPSFYNLVDYKKLQELAKPSLEGLAKCRKSLHQSNTAINRNPNQNYYDAYIGYSPYIKGETCLKRTIDPNTHNSALRIYRNSKEEKVYQQSLKGTKLARLISYTMNPELRKNTILKIMELYPQANFPSLYNQEWHAIGIRQNNTKEDPVQAQVLYTKDTSLTENNTKSKRKDNKKQSNK